MEGRIGKGSDPPTDRRCRCKGAYTRAAVGRGDYHSPGTRIESCTAEAQESGAADRNSTNRSPVEYTHARGNWKQAHIDHPEISAC